MIVGMCYISSILCLFWKKHSLKGEKMLYRNYMPSYYFYVSCTEYVFLCHVYWQCANRGLLMKTCVSFDSLTDLCVSVD